MTSCMTSWFLHRLNIIVISSHVLTIGRLYFNQTKVDLSWSFKFVMVMC